MTVSEQLKAEFDAEDGSFLLQLRCDLHWDRAAFVRLVATMQRYLETEMAPEAEQLPRWVAQGFWHLGDFVRDWSRHPNFPRIHPDDYYEAAYQRLFDLAYWLFCGESAYENRILEAFDA